MKKFCCLFLLLTLAACEDQYVEPLVFGAVIWPGYEPAYVARELGYLKGDRVHLAEFTNTTEVLRAFRNGQLNIAGLTLDEALELRHDIPDLQVFLVTDFSNGADMLMARRSIKNLGQLKGKRIGVEKTALGAYFLSLILHEAQLSGRDIKIISLPLDEQVQAFRTGAVDAVVTFGLAAGDLRREGAEVLFDSTLIPGKIVDTLVVRAADAKAHQSQLHEFIRAWFRALSVIQRDQVRTYPIIAKREQASVAEIAATMNGLTLLDKQKNLQQLAGNPPPLLATGNEIQRILKENGLTTGSDDLSQLINPRLIEGSRLD
ncbi:MAG: ABC transporter substrate-binding protein [Nitrosomonadales bacterium]|nr:ABC transporter substrate-binding protein [Nitrosomonadales bacterium]